VRTLNRYIGREVLASILLIFAALLMLFAFFDLIQELGDVGKANYSMGRAVAYVALHLPGRLYELFPVAALIGTLFALSQFVANSEYTVMRASGASLTRIAWAVMRVGLLLVVVTFAVGEFVAPKSERVAQQLRLQAKSAGETFVSQQFRSGFWFKQDQTFVNVRNLLPDSTLVGVRVFAFDADLRLEAIQLAERAVYQGNDRWQLRNVVVTRLGPEGATVEKHPELAWRSSLKPSILSVYQVTPEKLELDTLVDHIEMLGSNGQKTSRFEVALWTKIFYPAAVLVMMLIALPFAYFQRRSGGVGTRIFVGIMLGLAFFLLNRLFTFLGVLNDWPPLFSAVFPIAVFFVAAASLLWYLERR
jgi:lipopolysaccharide export system permease protein